MGRKRVLLIDDERTEISPNIMRRIDVIARNYFEGIKQLKDNGPWDVLLLDHDLSSYLDISDARTEVTGYDIMAFLEETLIVYNLNYIPKEIIFVTSNPEGRRRMIQAYESIKGRLR